MIFLDVKFIITALREVTNSIDDGNAINMSECGR